MVKWIVKHLSTIIAFLVSVVFVVYMYGCQAKTTSMMRDNQKVNRQELQLELDQIIGLAKLRMADLDKQEEFRAIILQNALILVQGQPFNPIGLLSAIAAIYGIKQGGSNITKAIKTNRVKKKVNNG